MGLVSALGASTSVMAADLDATAPGNAAESFATDTATTAEVNTDNTVDLNFNTGGVVQTTAIGVGVAGGNQTFVRFDLTASEFEGAVTAGNFSVTGTVASATAVAQGGADGGTFVIFDVTSNSMTPITQASDVNFGPAVAADLSGSASVAMTVYETLTGAVNQTDSLYSISGPFASFTEGLTTAVDPANPVAEVSTGFTQFSGTPTTLTEDVGDFVFGFSNTATSMNTGAAIAAFAEIAAVATTDITVEGDMSFGDWFIGDTAGPCGLITDLVEDTDTFDNATANAGGLTAGTHYNLCVTVDGTDDVINESSYSMLFEWDTGTNPFPAGDSTLSVGSITRNGTTVQIPYLTTFADYNQRLVIVNRGASAAAYSITFTSEDGVTATAGSDATGTVPAGEVVSLRASDIVTITGSATRTAATLIVVAPSANIDVATNQVNLSDGSTDTVVLQ